MVKNKTRKKRKIKTIKSKMRTLKSYSPTINKQFKSLKSNIKLQQLTTNELSSATNVFVDNPDF